MNFNLESIIEQVGYVGLFAIVFAESGLFFGFFLPGDSLLLTAGLLASRGYFDITILCGLMFIAATSGDQVGYWFGAKTGPRLFAREDSRFFKRKHLLAAQAFYEKHGGKTIMLARWVPIIRTFAPIVAGAAQMKYARFLSFNLLGGFIWGVGMTLFGWFLGVQLGHVEGIDKWFTLLAIAFFVIPGLPTAWHLWQENGPELIAKVKSLLGGKAAA